MRFFSCCLSEMLPAQYLVVAVHWALVQAFPLDAVPICHTPEVVAVVGSVLSSPNVVVGVVEPNVEATSLEGKHGTYPILVDEDPNEGCGFWAGSGPYS